MFKALFKKQMGELFTFFVAGKKGKRRSTAQTVGVILLCIFVVMMFIVMFAGMVLSICIPLASEGLDWFYFAVMGGLSLILGVFGSVFTAYNGIFVAKDNELLLSMPIKPKFIVFVRMLSLYIISFVFDALVLVSTGIIYFIFGNPTIATFIFFPISVFVLPMLSLTVSCILGWIIALIVPHVKNKNIITVIISVLFMGVYFVFCFGLGEYMETLIINITQIAESVKGNAYILYLFGAALRGEPIPFLVFLLISVGVFALVYFAISKTFLKLATTKRSGAKIKYREKELKTSGIKMALLKREAKHFFSSSAYLLNCGIGIIMIALVAIFAVVKGDTLVELVDLLSTEMPEITGIIPLIIALIMSFMMSMTIISAPSVSLEGKSIWLIQSLPVRGRDVLRSKVMFHAVAVAPISVISSVILCIITKVSVLSTVALVVYTISNAFLGAFLGVVINMLMPKLNFTNETVAVKQSGSVIVTMLILMALDAVSTVLVIFTWIFIPPYALLFAMAVVNVIACTLMNYYLATSGEKKFASLS